LNGHAAWRILTEQARWTSVQNPLGTDNLKAHAICCEAAIKYGSIVLPPFHQGLLGEDNWVSSGWAGHTLSFNTEQMLEAAILGIARALVFGKWKVLVGVTGHAAVGKLPCG
jgi:hypothetical protein